MAEQDPRVPPEVEQYFIALFSRAGAVGGTMGGGGGGGGGGGARGAKRLKTSVEDRAVASVVAVPEAVLAQLSQAFPKLQQLPSPDGVLRVAIPIGMTGLQKVVVDVSGNASEQGGSDGLLVRAYGKEGLMSRKPTSRTADQVAQVLSS